MHKSLLSLATVVSLSLAVPLAFATSTPTPLAVRAVVSGVCSVSVGASGHPSVMDFGDIADLSTDIDAVSWAEVTCSDGLGYSVSVGSGNNETGGQRRMTNGSGDHLPYDLYADNAYTELVAINGASSIFYTQASGIGGGTLRLPLFGRIPVGTTIPTAGTYTDTVMLMVTY